jgi:glutamine synthetase
MKQIKLEYIWLDGYTPEPNLRSKTKILVDDEFIGDQLDLHHLPQWSFDGSSTKQAKGNDSDCILNPVRLYSDPFRENGYLVLCDVWDVYGHKPAETNHRCRIQEQNKDNWFGFEQEYFIMKNGIPLGFPADGSFPKDQGEFYCGVGSHNVDGRQIVEEHLDACIKAGLRIPGINAEVCIGQWEYQLFAEGEVKAADDLWLSRYLLYRVAELYGVDICLHPKPIEDNSGYDANGSGMHINFSNSRLRNEGGEDYIKELMEEFEYHHELHIHNYGSDNDKRLSGKFETQHISKFSYGVSDRGASVRIPIGTAKNKWRGYLEDRRPGSNADPYKLTKLISDRLKGVTNNQSATVKSEILIES